MINRAITLILGAGASLPYGYPTGAGLIELISALLDWHIYTSPSSALLLKTIDHPNHRNEVSDFHLKIANFCLAVRKHQPTNIDSFLRDNPSLESFGRTVIAYLIRASEFNDRGLIVPSDIKIKPWYQILFEALVSRIPPEKISTSHRLRIITFNYDVSLEYFLATKLVEYERTRNFAKEIFDSIPIVHMFGKVGEVTINNGVVSYDYGRYMKPQNPHHRVIEQKLWEISEKCNLHVAIETKHKHTEVVKSSETAKEYLNSAEHVLCMGFDFALDNCDLLDMPQQYWEHHPTIYLNHSKAPNLDRRVQTWRKTRNNMVLLKANNCYDALVQEYDLTQ